MRRTLSPANLFLSLTLVFSLLLIGSFSAYSQQVKPKMAGTPLQQGLRKAIEERKDLGLPVPSSVSYEYDVDTGMAVTAGMNTIRLTGKTVVEFDGPEQAELERWPDFVVEDNLPPDSTGFVQPGNYNQAVYDALEEQFSGIWEDYEFGYEPRKCTIEETFVITYPEEFAQMGLPTPTAALDSITVDEIVMGFTYPGPNIDYSIHEKWEVLGVTVAEARAGFVLDWALGLRLPVQVSLTTPDLMTTAPYWLTSALTPLDWSQAQFENAGVPRPESGKEFLLQFEFFLGFWVEIAGIRVLDASVEMNLDKSTSFTTPFGPGASFPIPDLVLSPDDTGLKKCWAGIACVGIGLRIDPDLGSEKITADWQAVPGSDATGSGVITYTDTNPVTFGPVTGGDFGPTEYAHIRLDDFRYWFNVFLIKLSGWLTFDIFGFGVDTGEFDIVEFDLSGLTDDLYVETHDGTDGSVDAYVFVNIPPVVDAGPDANVLEGSEFISSGSFTDPNVTDSWTATVDYDDGSGVQPLALKLDKTFDLMHIYCDNGLYIVTVVVTDSYGATGSDTAAVTVINVIPTVDAGADQKIMAGDFTTFTGTYSDPGWCDTHTALWDFGDGGATAAGVVIPNAVVPPNPVTGTVTVIDPPGGHSYFSAGDHTVELAVTDDDGGVGKDTLTVEVEYIPAVIDFDMDTVNKTGGGKWVTVYIELLVRGDVKKINLGSVRLQDPGGGEPDVPAETDPKFGFVKSEDSYIMDTDEDGELERMVKFPRKDVAAILEVGDAVEIAVTGCVEYTNDHGDTGCADFKGTDTIRVIDEGNDPAAAPALVASSALEVSEPFPTPCNPEVWIPYRLGRGVAVDITIYSTSGKIIRTLKLGYQEAGAYMSKDKAAYWDGRNEAGEQVSSGVYFCTIQADDFTATKKIVVVK